MHTSLVFQFCDMSPHCVFVRLKEFYSDGVSPIMDFFQTLSELLSPDAGTVISKTSFLGNQSETPCG